MQTSPISFVFWVPFPRATKEIGDVCTQANYSQWFKKSDFEMNATLEQTPPLKIDDTSEKRRGV